MFGLRVARCDVEAMISNVVLVSGFGDRLKEEGEIILDAVRC